MADVLRLTFDDFDGDAQTTSLNVHAMTAEASFAAWQTKLDNLYTAIDAATSGRFHKREDIIRVADNGSGKATTPIAQSAIQLILEVEDQVTLKTFTERIPFPALGASDDVGGDPLWVSTGIGSSSLTVMNPDHDYYAALKTAYDAVGSSPEGNDTVLLRAYVEE